MIDKAPDAYRTISEAAEELDLPQHVLRFWETRFSQIKPLKRGGGRRYYRPDDVELLKGIRHLLYSEGYTIKGVQRILKEQGPKAVQALMRDLIPDEDEAIETPAVPPPPPFEARRESPRRIEPSLAAPAPAPVPPPPVIAEPLLPPIAVALPQPSAAPHPAPHSAPPPAADDLFSASDIARAMVPPAAIPPTAPIAPVPQPPTVSFMRGGLSRPPGSAPPAPASEPEPAPAGGINVRRSIRPVPPEDLVDEDRPPPAPVEPPSPAASRPELTEAGRRALQSALFELSECRRVIERVTATMVRGR